jgi:hypothetical protein
MASPKAKLTGSIFCHALMVSSQPPFGIIAGSRPARTALLIAPKILDHGHPSLDLH